MGSQLLQQHFTFKHRVALSGQSETDLYCASPDTQITVKLFNTMLGIFYQGICFCK